MVSAKQRGGSASGGKTDKSQRFGGMAEWSIAAVLKTVVLKGTVGSNPTPSE